MGYYEDLEHLTEALGDLLEEYLHLAQIEGSWADDAEERGDVMCTLSHGVSSNAYAWTAMLLRRVLNKHAPGRKVFSVPGDW